MLGLFRSSKHLDQEDNIIPVLQVGKLSLREINGLLCCQTLFSGSPKSLQMVIAAMKLKDAYSLEGKL